MIKNYTQCVMQLHTVLVCPIGTKTFSIPIWAIVWIIPTIQKTTSFRTSNFIYLGKLYGEATSTSTTAAAAATEEQQPPSGGPNQNRPNNRPGNNRYRNLRSVSSRILQKDTNNEPHARRRTKSTDCLL
jgi:hypothetical protein